MVVRLKATVRRFLLPEALSGLTVQPRIVPVAGAT